LKLAARIKRLEKLRPPEPYAPPIFFHSVVEPSKDGPKEVGAFAKIYLNGDKITLWRAEDEAQSDFEIRVMNVKAEREALYK
jgi:hypothetical protein